MATIPAEWFEQFDGKDYMGMYRQSIGDSGAMSVADYLSRNASITKIDLSINDIGPPGASALGNMLESNTSLLEFNFNLNPVQSQGAISLARGISANKTLTEVDLHADSIGEEGIESIAHAVASHESITSLTLFQNGAADRGASAFIRAIDNASGCSLRSLNIGSNAISAAGIRGMLASNSFGGLTRVILSHNKISDDGAAAIAAALAGGDCSLEELNVSENEITEQGAGHIAEALRSNVSLKILDISINPLGSTGVRSIAKALSEASGLSTAPSNFNNNSSGGSSFENESSGLGSNLPSSLTASSSSSSLASASSARHHSFVESIDVSSTECGDIGFACLCDASCSHGSPRLERITCANNSLALSSAQALSKAVRHSASLRVVDMSDNLIGTDDVRLIAEACESARVIEEIILYGNEEADQDAIDQLEEILEDESRLEPRE